MKTIDLGLPSHTLWGETNLGANSQTDCGSYFAWGDTHEKGEYVGRTCPTYDLDIMRLKFDDFVNSYDVLTREYDAAAQHLGEDWRIPSGQQAQELVDNCNWQWVTNYEGSGANGMSGVSKINGNIIFFPAAGYKHNSDVIMNGRCGGYWTGTPNFTAANRAWSIAFEPNVINVFNHGLRYNGYSIRPVKH